jgi:hypothetical protein
LQAVADDLIAVGREVNGKVAREIVLYVPSGGFQATPSIWDSRGGSVDPATAQSHAR